MAHPGLSHALFTSNPYLLGLSTSDRAGCAVRCAAELFLNALESNATEVRVEVRAAGGGVVEVEVTDDGDGFDDAVLRHAGELFASTKHADGDAATAAAAAAAGADAGGVHGTGLASVLVASSLLAPDDAADGALSVLTSRADADEVVKLTVTLGKARAGGTRPLLSLIHI